MAQYDFSIDVTKFCVRYETGKIQNLKTYFKNYFYLLITT